MDFVNASNPPDYVLLYCERQDVLGGGQTKVADNAVIARLRETSRARLSERRYQDGAVRNLDNVGIDINPFAILNEGDYWHFRYTSNLTRKDGRDVTLPEELQELAELLATTTRELQLQEGQFIVLDQHRVLHGKTPLGHGQENISPCERRLLWQAFGRSWDNIVLAESVQ